MGRAFSSALRNPRARLCVEVVAFEPGERKVFPANCGCWAGENEVYRGL